MAVRQRLSSWLDDTARGTVYYGPTTWIGLTILVGHWPPGPMYGVWDTVDGHELWSGQGRAQCEAAIIAAGVSLDAYGKVS